MSASSSLPSEAITKSIFICDCGKLYRSVCAGESFYKEHEGKQYCVLHFPGKEKSEDFATALRRKLNAEDFDFRGVWFPDEVSFSGITFNTDAYFSVAVFSEDANFNRATFAEDVNFSHATFEKYAGFGSATFKREVDFGTTFKGEAYFRSAIFKREANFETAKFGGEADFIAATFNAEARFDHVTFNGVAAFFDATFKAEARFANSTFNNVAGFSNAVFNADARFANSTFDAAASFSFAILKEHVTFSAHTEGLGFTDQSSLEFQHARIEKPEHVSFYTLTLRPHWFVNVDARKFDFTNVEWRGGLKHRHIKQEIEDLKKNKISSPHRLLAIACRQLAVNAEENHRYEEASKFRYWAMDARRRESRFGFAPWKLGWWYWAASGYGERVFRAFLVLLGVWLLFAWLYTQPNTNRLSVQPNIGFAYQPRTSNGAAISPDESIEPLEFMDALTYSAGVMTLQKPEPRPATRLARGLVLLETILGPLQAALLALAIRRKFMR